MQTRPYYETLKTEWDRLRKRVRELEGARGMGQYGQSTPPPLFLDVFCSASRRERRRILGLWREVKRGPGRGVGSDGGRMIPRDLLLSLIPLILRSLRLIRKRWGLGRVQVRLGELVYLSPCWESWSIFSPCLGFHEATGVRGDNGCAQKGFSCSRWSIFLYL